MSGREKAGWCCWVATGCCTVGAVWVTHDAAFALGLAAGWFAISMLFLSPPPL
jgi:hypothetical protein